jgi:hypothetical protein
MMARVVRRISHRPRRRVLWLACSASLTTLGAVRDAHAIACDALPSAVDPDAGVPPVLYVEGANAVGPFIAPLQQALSVDPNPINVIYIGDGGCVGAGNFFNDKSISSSPAPIYYAAQTAYTCELPSTGGPAGGPPVTDLAASDVYAPSCGNLPGGVLPSNIADFLGPIQPMAFVVPKGSMQLSISAEAAYFVFGFGSDSGLSPWTVNSSIYRRNANSAVQALLAIAIGVPLPVWAGVDATKLSLNVTAGVTGAAAVINGLETDSNPEQAIGILADTNIDATTASHINILAYQDSGQSCGYYPDSTATSHDKGNVRDGHYPLWGPIHFFTYVDANGVPVNPNVARFLSYVTGTAVAPGGVDLIQIDAQNNLVPLCAMRVTRSVELGPLASYAPAASCGCYYDYQAIGQSTCPSCTKQSDCPASAPVCNLSYSEGFCETQ